MKNQFSYGASRPPPHISTAKNFDIKRTFITPNKKRKKKKNCGVGNEKLENIYFLWMPNHIHCHIGACCVFLSRYLNWNALECSCSLDLCCDSPGNRTILSDKSVHWTRRRKEKSCPKIKRKEENSQDIYTPPYEILFTSCFRKLKNTE